MRFTLNQWKKCISMVLAVVLLSGCTDGVSQEGTGKSETKAGKQASENMAEAEMPLTFDVIPETFALSIGNGNVKIPFSEAGEKRQVKNWKQSKEEASWEYPERDIHVSIRTEANYLRVTITSMSEEDNEFTWPSISGDVYYMPFGEGKRIPADDKVWQGFTAGERWNVMEQLSMPFWSVVKGEKMMLCIMENPYRNELAFSENGPIEFALVHPYPAIASRKENSFRIYLTEDDPVKAAKIYRNYVKEKGKFKTLAQKAEKNPEVGKLFGAPHIYLWGELLIEPDDIHWKEFRKAVRTDRWQPIVAAASGTETGAEAVSVMKDVAAQDYVDDYQKKVICRSISEIVKGGDLYDAGMLKEQDEAMEEYIQQNKAFKNMTETERIRWNKHVLTANFPEIWEPADSWMDGSTVELVQKWKDSGIDRAWIGLNSWEQAYAKPELVKEAIKQGYLIGPYDSYHSIHPPGKEQWITAKFSDTSLYESASITKQNGEKEKGFQNVGRKLNPVLAFPAVEQRVNEILSNQVPFNSWFVDCDATGEIYDDYSPEHITTQEEDVEARLKRMLYLQDQHSMVVGSEGGNDFAAPAIAFAHGLELKSFSWMDEDMKSNQDSEYYIGKYYNSSGGVAEHFAKRIPVKKKYYHIFVDPAYDVPLFKLVYNDSVITSYHWDWSTFKIEGATRDRMLREILYNVPPLFHLDAEEWKRYGKEITSHVKVWSTLSEKAVLQEMTDFRYLNEEGTVQKTVYGEDICVVANFSDQVFTYEKDSIPAHTLWMKTDSEERIYSPKVSEENEN